MRAKPSLRTVEERNALVMANTGIVGHVIKRLSEADRKLLGGWDDCFQLGVIALMRAAELYNPDRISTARKPGLKASFGTYAHTAVSNYLSRAITQSGLVRVPYHEWRRRVRQHEKLPVTTQWPTYSEREDGFINALLPVDMTAPVPDDPHRNDDVKRAVGALSTVDREILEEHFVRDIGTLAMARKRRCCRGTVRFHINSALSRTRKVLERQRS